MNKYIESVLLFFVQSFFLSNGMYFLCTTKFIIS